MKFYNQTAQCRILLKNKSTHVNRILTEIELYCFIICASYFSICSPFMTHFNFKSRQNDDKSKWEAFFETEVKDFNCWFKVGLLDIFEYLSIFFSLLYKYYISFNSVIQIINIQVEKGLSLKHFMLAMLVCKTI